MATNYNERLKAFESIYPSILKMSLGENSPLAELKTMLEDFSKNDVIKGEDKFKTLAQTMMTLSQSVIAQSQNTALNMILQGDENELNAEKIKLIQAQIETEKKKPQLIARQTAQIDDNLRIETAKIAQGYCFGLSAGGLEIPKEIEEWVKEKIENVDKK
ncbi:hypothetical protein [Campylobacter sp. CCS1377]|uniref:Uncharacterized protein n=1 Tax=Campylobacter sp. CCS1377 TaxID=3158229 RepID=A0AAU7E4R1_9BACT